ncbi:MAG: CO/xanthine dehydrogenase FAD-binding subunit [Gammaproteobacteria bacterium]|jgi:CO/xanthine dehydrogenase FAD-binding subunit
MPGPAQHHLIFLIRKQSARYTVKAAKFDYIRADDLAHAQQLLQQSGGDAKLIAGGQSLVPMMAMRLAQPAQLVDINRLEQLKQRSTNEHTIRIGAAVRQCELESDRELAKELAKALPLLRQVMPWVGHQQTRNRGTLGGSLVHADPSAELPLAALILDARLCLASEANGERWLPASEFFIAPMECAINDTECLTEIEWPRWSGERIAAAFDEIAIRKGDFAIATAGCQMQLDDDARISRIAFGLGGVAGTPLAFPQLSTRLIGQALTGEMISDTVSEAVQHTDPGSDMHAGANYRRHLAATLLQRVLTRAYDELSGSPGLERDSAYA